MPEPFPWENTPPAGEHYIAIDQSILEALRALAFTADYDRHVMPTIRAVLRVAAVDPHGRVVIAVRLTRDLGDPGQTI